MGEARAWVSFLGHIAVLTTLFDLGTRNSNFIFASATAVTTIHEIFSSSSKISPFIQKLQQAPNGYRFEPEGRPEPVDVLAPRQGSYFCYGTLVDLLCCQKSSLFQASQSCVERSSSDTQLKLLGEYPALMDGLTVGQSSKGWSTMWSTKSMLRD